LRGRIKTKRNVRYTDPGKPVFRVAVATHLTFLIGAGQGSAHM